MELGSQIKMGTQVGNTFVPAHLRQHGLGFRGMRGAVHRLLQTSHIVTLLAHEKTCLQFEHICVLVLKSTPFRVIRIDLKQQLK